jgi:hypothetical protein
MPASGPPPWGPDDTGAVPVGPEPEPTGAAGGGTGPGGWGGKPKLEPFAIAALVWALVSIVLPLVGTIVALVLAARAADAIRRSRGTRSGTEMVTAARIIAGGVIALWAIGLVAFVALGGNDDSGNKVAVPTQPPVTSTTAVSATTAPPTTTVPPSTTTSSLPQPSVIVDPTQPPTTQPPPTQPPPTTLAPTTAPPTTAPPTTAPPTTAPPTTAPPTTTTTSPQQAVTAKIEAKIGPSNRNVPPDERVDVQYTPGTTIVVTWAINNGQGTLPTGQPTCAAPPTSTTSTTTPGATTTTSTSTTTTTTTPGAVTTTTVPQDEGTRMQARKEARLILQTLRPDIRSGKLDVTGVQLVGTYPIVGPGTGDVDVVQVFYSKADIDAALPPQPKVFEAPPATTVQCLNPAFD